MSESTALARTRSDVETVSNDLVIADMIKDVAMIPGEVQRWVVKVPLKPVHQYVIRSGKKINDRWVDVFRVFPTAEAYDWMNRIMGVQLHVPEWVHDERGEAVRNPIHRRDYIYLRMVGIGYNDLGQMIAHAEDVEIDYMVEWQKERLKQKSAKVVLDENGMPKLTDGGVPVVQLDPADELKAYQRLYQLRSFGPRQAQTVARTRILKLFSGVRTLYESVGQEPSVAPVAVTVVGYRDRMTPDERIKKSQEEQGQVFGSGIRAGDEEIQPHDEEYVTVHMEAEEAEAEHQEVAQESLVAMPGEKIAKAADVCGATGVVGPAPCTQKPGHAPFPHKSEDGVWPSS